MFSFPVHKVNADPINPRVKYGGVLPDAYYDALAQCETSSNWKHSTKSYTGGLGIYRGTWRHWSGSKSALGKSPKQQVKVADNIAFLGYVKNGVYNKPVGPWGWGCVKNYKYISKYICKSNHRLVKQYKRRCN
jgi:hypothetical protein